MINISLSSHVIWCSIYVTVECKIWKRKIWNSTHHWIHFCTITFQLVSLRPFSVRLYLTNLTFFSSLKALSCVYPSSWWIFTTSHWYFYCVTLEAILMCSSRVAARNRRPRRTSRKNEWSYTSASISCSGQLFLLYSSRSRLKIFQMHNRLTEKY
jgi:hypothetical protein